MPYPYYIPPYLGGEDYIREHGLPSAGAFTDVKIPTPPVMDPLQSGMQFGLLGAASGLGYTALNRAMTGRKPGGWRTARNITAGALLGAVFGALAANENRRRFGGRPVGSYSDVAGAISGNLGKAGAEKRALGPLLAIPLLFGALGAYSTAQSGGKAIKALAQGQGRAAAGHGLATLGNLGLTLMGAGPLAVVGRSAKFLRPMIPALVRGGKINNALWGIGAKTRAMRWGMPVASTMATSGIDAASRGMLAPKALPAAAAVAQAPKPAIGARLLRAVPTPTQKPFATLI